MRQPAVSIILPTFNRLKYLRAAIDSVFAQTFSDWELIIADDGSDSETGAYLEAVAGRARTRVLRLVHTGNPAAVRNIALSEATGGHVAFLDSDDVWLADKLRFQLALHRARERCRWSYTAEELIDARGRLLPSQPAAPPDGLHEGMIFDQLMTLSAALSTTCVMAERRLVEEVGGFDESLPFFEDYDLWLRLSLRSEVAALSAPLALVRNHNEHYSADRIGVCEARLRLLDKVAGAMTAVHRQTILLEERAKTSLDLARALAASGRRPEAVRALWKSRELASRGKKWWSGAMYTLTVATAPTWLRAWVRRYRAVQ